MNLTVDNVTHITRHLTLVGIIRNRINHGIHRTAYGEMHPTLRLEKSGLHRKQVVALGLLEFPGRCDATGTHAP